MMEVTLLEMLEAREKRAQKQQYLLERFSSTIICFTMNIAGPVKKTESIVRAFHVGCEKIQFHISEEQILYKEFIEEKTGCEAYYVVKKDAVSLKKICTAIEDESVLGRLFDMDVLDTNGMKLDRSTVNGKSRDCIVCGAVGRGCASRRLHSVAELQLATDKIIYEYFAREDSERIGAYATQSLLEEVFTTPKPGLVDCNNSGSHDDMNVFTFIASATSLQPYFVKCTRIGQNNQDLSYEELFKELQKEGLLAEQKMYASTNGVNTHKGAIYLFGLLCGAIGRCWSVEKPIASIESILDVNKKIAKVAMEETYKRLEDNATVKTTGEKLLKQNGISGVRGEAASGLLSVMEIALPIYESLKMEGLEQNKAGYITLLHLISNVIDTNLYSRGGEEGAQYAMELVKNLLSDSPNPKSFEVEKIDQLYIEKNLSPGGCADLLAVTYFVNKLKNS